VASSLLVVGYLRELCACVCVCVCVCLSVCVHTPRTWGGGGGVHTVLKTHFADWSQVATGLKDAGYIYVNSDDCW
jgi:hypothetical protein